MLVAVGHDDDIALACPQAFATVNADPAGAGGDDVEDDQAGRARPQDLGELVRSR